MLFIIIKPLQNPRKRSKDDPVLIVFMDGEMHLTVHDFTNPKWKLDECPVPCKFFDNTQHFALYT